MNKTEFERYLCEVTAHIPPTKRKGREDAYPLLCDYANGPRQRGGPWRYGAWLRERHLPAFNKLYEEAMIPSHA